ncbi:MAG: septum formation protein Maf [Fidelibacterota bacterium]|nr:MAG: septum formation protein Maf [Candidatus Neomarinimicrobiota bacterium]
MRLILASVSPRRQELLGRLGISFVTVRPEYEEQHYHEEDPEATCRRLAQGKAIQVAQRFPEDLIVGADTIVILGSQVMGKPDSLDEARRMLQALSGQTHLVKTAVALVCSDLNHQSVFVETTEVAFHHLEEDDIERYLSVDPPLDKAGAYGIQDWSGVFVQQVAGCYHNVVGFPLARFYRHLKDNNLWPRLLALKHL